MPISLTPFVIPMSLWNKCIPPICHPARHANSTWQEMRLQSLILLNDTGIERLWLQVAELASLAQLLPPCSPTMRNPAPDSSLKSCFSPIASASAAARRLRPLLPGPIAASASTAAPRLPPPPAAAPRLRPLQLLLALLAAFMISSCCSRSRPLRLLLPDCVRFNCCSLIASASTAARPIASASTAAPRLHTGFHPAHAPGPMFSNILRGVRGSVNKLKTKVARHYSLVPPHEHPTSVTHTHTDT